MKVTALIVTYNRINSLQYMLPKVLDEDFEAILIVDNASTDKTSIWLNSLNDHRITILTLPENIGGAGGFELGVKTAIEGENPPDWVVLFDDDAWPVKGCISKFKSKHWEDDIGAVSAMVTYPDGTVCEMNRQSNNPFWSIKYFIRSIFFKRGVPKGFKVSDEEYSQKGKIKDIDTASFVGFFLRATTANVVGPPDGKLFIYGDDVLYCLKLRKKGWRIVLLSDLQFIHDCKTIGNANVFRPLWKNYYLARNGVKVAYSASNFAIFPAALGYYMLNWFLRGQGCTSSERRIYYKLLLMGIMDGLKGKSGKNKQVHQLASTVGKRPFRV